MLQFMTHVDPWVTMAAWQILIWALVIGGILALRGRHDR